MPSTLIHAHDTLPSLPSLLARDLRGAPRRSALASLMERLFFLTLALLLVVISASSLSTLLQPDQTPRALAARARCPAPPPC